MFLYSDYYNRITTKLSQARILASWASVYTDAPFRHSGLPSSSAKQACWGHPQSPMIANFVVRLNGPFDRCSAFRKKKKDGAGQ